MRRTSTPHGEFACAHGPASAWTRLPPARPAKFPSCAPLNTGLARLARWPDRSGRMGVLDGGSAADGSSSTGAGASRRRRRPRRPLGRPSAAGAGQPVACGSSRMQFEPRGSCRLLKRQLVTPAERICRDRGRDRDRRGAVLAYVHSQSCLGLI